MGDKVDGGRSEPEKLREQPDPMVTAPPVEKPDPWACTLFDLDDDARWRVGA